MTPKRLLAAAVAVLVVASLALAMRLQHVHDETWEWRLQPTATPPLVHYDGRDYRRSGAPPDLTDLRHRGTTPGGGTIYAPTGVRTAVTIVVVDGRHAVSYGLMGGP